MAGRWMSFEIDASVADSAVGSIVGTGRSPPSLNWIAARRVSAGIVQEASSRKLTVSGTVIRSAAEIARMVSRWSTSGWTIVTGASTLAVVAVRSRSAASIALIVAGTSSSLPSRGVVAAQPVGVATILALRDETWIAVRALRDPGLERVAVQRDGEIDLAAVEPHRDALWNVGERARRASSGHRGGHSPVDVDAAPEHLGRDGHPATPADDVDRPRPDGHGLQAGGQLRCREPGGVDPGNGHARQDAVGVVAIERQRGDDGGTDEQEDGEDDDRHGARHDPDALHASRTRLRDGCDGHGNSPNSRHPARRRARGPGGPTRSCRRAHGALCPARTQAGARPRGQRPPRGGYDAAGRSGGTGRRGGLKLRCPQGRPSSNLGSGTTADRRGRLLCCARLPSLVDRSLPEGDS